MNRLGVGLVGTIFLVSGGCPTKVKVGVSSDDGAAVDVLVEDGQSGSSVGVEVDLSPPPAAVPTFRLKISVEGEGRVEILPAQDVYELGSRVMLWALPEEGFTFAEWTGDISGKVNPLELVVTEGLEIGALFVAVNPPPAGQVPSVDLKVNGKDGPLDLTAGATITLSWNAKSAETVTASGGWSGAKAAAGKEKLGPFSAGVYVFVLTAVNEFGTAVDAVTTNVKPPGGQQQVLKIEKLKPAEATVTFKVGEPMEFSIRLTGGVGPFRHRMRFPDFPENPVFNLDSPDREVNVTHAFKNPVRPGPLDGFEDLIWNVTDLGTGAEVRTSFYIKVVL